MKQRTANALTWGAVAATLSLSVALPQCVEEGPRGPSKPQITMTMVLIDDGHTVPAGAGVEMGIGKGRLKLSCVNEYAPFLPDNADWLDKGKSLTVNGVKFKGLDDKGIEVTAAGETEHVFLSATTRCTVLVDGKAVAEVYNPGAGTFVVWVYPK